ncbi:RNA polymerase factor sigma-54 [Haematobacter missouriensis]|nr:RNA polymerase sigma-54 factor [Haematobacter missouriensis]
MTIAPRQRQSQRQTLGFLQMQVIGLLGLTNEGLGAHLARRAAANPLIRLRLPAGAATPETEEVAAQSGGIHDHLMRQMRLILSSDAEIRIGMEFIESVDTNGWIDRSPAEIAARAGHPVARAEAVLRRLQLGVEPTGLFARDLGECLRLQAAERGQLDPAMWAVIAHLPALAQGGPQAIVRATGFDAADVARCLGQIRRMDPRPGRAFGDMPAPIREPDVIVTRKPGGWQVALNRATLPVLTVAPGDPANPALRSARAEAEWLGNFIERRNRTVLRVARAVLARQEGFLENGPAGLAALYRTEIARDLGLHDSTVGRVARDLLVETPYGIRSLCSLFDRTPRGDARADTPRPAASAIRHRLAQIIAAEDPARPQSDAELAAILALEGKALARRTVAKLRGEIGIASRAARRRRQPA